MGEEVYGGGGLHRRKDGRWEGRYTVPTADGPKRRSVYGKTKKEATRKLVQAVADRDRGLVFDTQNLAVGDYLDRWLNDSVRDAVKRRTFEGYVSIVGRHIKPALGHLKLARLTPAHVQGLYRAKLDSGLSPTTVQHIHTILHRAIKQAVRWGMIPRNVCEAVSVPRRDSREMTPLTPTQARALLQAASGDPLEALYVLAVTTGMRQGELLGLHWKDVDLDRRVVRVSQTLVTGNGKQTIEKPKTSKSRRSVALTRRAVNALTDHKTKQWSAGYRNEGLVFTSQSGGPVDPDNLRRRSFARLLKRAGLSPIRFHDLRHTCATLLLGGNVHPKIVQGMLGHATITVTTDTYSHFLPNMQGPAISAMDDVLE